MSHRIPRKLRDSIRAKEFDQILAVILPDNEERRLLEDSYILDDHGVRHLAADLPPDRQKSLLAVWKKVRKSRTRPRYIRLGLLLVIIGVIVAANLLWLDSWIAARGENFLETVTGTDVTVSDFDLSLFRLRVTVGRLAFASTNDPMVDAWGLSNLEARLDGAALLRRRFNVRRLTGSLETARARTQPAVYPDTGEPAEPGTSPTDGSPAGDAVPFDFGMMSLIPMEDLSSPALIQEIADSSRSELDTWRSAVEQDFVAVEGWISRVEAYVNTPLPGKTDLAGWAKLADEGRVFSSELTGLQSRLDTHERRIADSMRRVQGSTEAIRVAMEADWLTVRNTVDLSPGRLEGILIDTARVYGGDRLVTLYRHGRKIVDRLREYAGNRGRRDQSRSTLRRRVGRRVPFPVREYPRFSIQTLRIDSPQSPYGVLVGTNLASDPDILGEPARVEARAEENGRKWKVSLTVDGRSGAMPRVYGDVAVTEVPWNIVTPPLAGLSGTLATTSQFSIDAAEAPFRIDGAVNVAGWRSSSEGPLQDLARGLGDIGLAFDALVDADKWDLRLSLDEESGISLSDALEKMVLSGGKEAFFRAITEESGAEWGFVAGLEDTWSGEKDLVETTNDALEQWEPLLEEKIREATGSSALPVMGGEGGLLDNIGGGLGF